MTFSAARLSNADAHWQAIVNRDPRADGEFVYSVRTTGVYCRPVCPARRPLRENVRFHTSCDDAERAGFRPCERCKPNGTSHERRQTEIVESACRTIEAADSPPRLDDLAKAANLSRYHFHRLFKSQTGVTPKAYSAACRNGRIRRELMERSTVTEAIYAAGLTSSSRLYEGANATLGMTPQRFRAGGKDVVIRFAVGECWLGAILVAATEKGVCAILLGDDPDALVRELQDRFPSADLIGGDKDFERTIAVVVGFVANPAIGLNLPLDVQGTAFQQRVWQALRKIPAGATVTYSEIAKRIGNARAIRAVAGACAANPLAVAIPCHRVVRTDGSLAGYRWGVERKRKLLKREHE